jgi:hypothetical protein
MSVKRAPFEVGERVHASDLGAWTYTGLSGKPGKDKHAVRRFKKGIWVLEVYAHEDPSRASRVASIRTAAEDALHWQETRQRLVRHKNR